MDIKKEILSKYPEADIYYLDKYLEICNRPSKEGQFHHILPRKIWPKYIKSDWNICIITPYNHVLAHFYFSKATGALWNAIRWFSGKNNPAKTIEEAEKVAKIYSEFIKEYSWSSEHKANHLEAQNKEWLSKLRSDNTKANWQNPDFKERLLKSRKENYTSEVKEKRCKAQMLAQSKPETKAKRSSSMKDTWKDPVKRKTYMNNLSNQRKSDYWNFPLKKKLFDIWCVNKPKKCNFSNILLNEYDIKLSPNQLRILVDEFFDKGYVEPV